MPRPSNSLSLVKLRVGVDAPGSLLLRNGVPLAGGGELALIIHPAKVVGTEAAVDPVVKVAVQDVQPVVAQAAVKVVGVAGVALGPKYCPTAGAISL
jgi:hypothetical protein